jgi:hypothetical protein
MLVNTTNTVFDQAVNNGVKCRSIHNIYEYHSKFYATSPLYVIRTDSLDEMNDFLKSYNPRCMEEFNSNVTMLHRKRILETL